MSAANLKPTALLEEHRKLKGRLIDFGGWELPVQYTGVIDEHVACRTGAGLFDVSHMGEIIVEGDDAEAFLNRLLTNDVAKMVDGQAQYSAMCYEDGGIVDDLITYRRSAGRYLVVVNASNTDKDFEWMRKIHAQFGFRCRLENRSAEYSQIAIQGPKAVAILQKITKTPLDGIKTYHFREGQVLGGVPAILARTGYTGEDGFEVYTAWNDGPKVWSALMEAGAAEGIKPCGLGARDTLRLEVKYPLYGNELTAKTNPLEAGLGWVVKLDKDFVGRAALVAAKEKGLTRKLVGFKLLGAGIPRQEYRIFDAAGTREIGVVTSGTHSPCLKIPVGIGYVETSAGAIGTKIAVDIRGNKIPAEIVATPFYKKA